MIRTLASTVLGAAATLALVAWPAARADADPFRIVTADEVSRMLGAADVRIYDVNDRDVYDRGHVPGAVFGEKPLAKLLPQDKATRLVFYCKNPK